jgi:hypothetical protein
VHRRHTPPATRKRLVPWAGGPQNHASFHRHFPLSQPAPESAMTNATLAGQPDPFVTVLDSLGRAAAAVGELDDPITAVQSIVSAVDGVLDDLDKIPALLTGIDELLGGLRAVLALLDAVPFVDVVAVVCTDAVTVAEELLAEATEAFTTVDESVIKPCRVAFDDLQAGLTEAHDVVHTLSTTIPAYVNTLEILHFMAEIAAPLTEVLQGSQPAEDLGTLLRTLNGVQEEVGQALLPLSGFFNGLRTVVHGVSQALDSVSGEMEATMQGVEKGLNDVEDIFDPVVNAFNSIADTIKPIRWALDAISWIFDTVCEPVIEEVLKATGLDGLVHGLEGEVEAKLGITPIVALVKSNLSGEQADAWQAQGGSAAATSGQSALGKLSGVLKQYNTRDSASLKSDIDLLIGAIAGTPIDPDKPGVIPDWPEQPGLEVPDGQASARSVGAAAIVSTRAIPLHQALRSKRLTGGFLALAAIPNPATPAPRPDVPGVLANTAGSGGVPSLDALRALATQARGHLADAATLGPGLVADLQSYDQARALPAAFRESMQDLSDLLNDGVQLLDFVEQFGFLTALLEDLKVPLAGQASAISGILGACDDLAQAGDAMDAVIGQVIQAVPSASVFTAALDYMDRVALGAASLSSAMAQARGLDARLNNTHGAALDGLQSQLDASAAAVTAQTSQVESLATASLAAAGTVHGILTAYAAALGKLSGDADVISSDALPNLGKGVHLLNILASILDPLSGLLRTLDCVDGGNPTKTGAAAAIDAFRTSAAATINGQDQALRGFFGVVLSSALHTDRMSADIQAIITLVQQDQAAFDQARQQLATVLAALAGAIKPAQSFPSTDKAGNPITVDNLFIDPAFAGSAQAVFGAVQQAAKDAGLIPGGA